MKEKEKFDDIFRSKFSEQEFSFSEENWEKAERSLDSGRKRKKVLRYGLIFLAGLFAGIAIMFPLVNKDKSGENKLVTQIVEQRKEASPVPANEIKAKNPVSDSETTSGETKNIPEEKTVQPDKKITISSPEKTRETKNNHTNVSLNENIVADATVKKNNNNEKQNEKPEQKVNVNFETQPQNGSMSISATGHVKTDSLSANEPAKKKQEEKSVEQVNIVPEIQSRNISNASILIGMSVKRDSINEKKITALQSKIDSLDKVIALGFAKDSAKPKKDSASVTQPVNAPAQAPAPIPQPSSSVNIFSIDAGTYYNLGWQYGDTVEAKGFNPVFGFGFTHLFSPHWSLSTGFQYGSIGHLTVSTKTFSTSNPDFGSNTVDSIIDTKWIHYAVVPVFVQYHFNKKNSIGMGGSISYLVNTTSNFIVNSNSDYKNPVHTEKKTFGYTKGFNQWNATFAVAYSRRFFDKFMVSAEIHYGLMDIKDNTFFSKQKFERNTGIKLLLSYDLF